MTKSYLEFFKATGLMGARGWPGAATNELHMFWHERFMVPTPPELVVLLYPFLPKLGQIIKELVQECLLSKACCRLRQYHVVCKALFLVTNF